MSDIEQRLRQKISELLDVERRRRREPRSSPPYHAAVQEEEQRAREVVWLTRHADQEAYQEAQEQEAAPREARPRG